MINNIRKGSFVMRKKGSNGQRIENVEDKYFKLEKEISDLGEKYKEHIRLHVIDDLQETRYNGKPYYSYADIAERHHISVAAVQRIAISEGLTRRGKA